MAKSKQQIIDEITAHIQKRGGAFPDWYVGTGSTARNRLFRGHKVRQKGDRWIHRRADSPQAAREVENYFVSTLSTDGPAAPGGDAAVAVYAYKKSPHTKP